MIVGWFDATQATKIGQSLAMFLITRIPPGSSENMKKSEAKQEKVISKIYRQAEQAISEHKLNAYKKGKLADAFQKELLNAGYDPEFVREVTRGIVLKVGYR